MRTEPKPDTNVAGILILLFLAGLVPLSSVIFLLLALCALSSYIQYTTVIRQEFERQSATTDTPGFQAQPSMQPEQAQHAAVLSMINTVVLNNRRSGIMSRDYYDSGVLAACFSTHCGSSGLQARGADFASPLLKHIHRSAMGGVLKRTRSCCPQF